jgi:heme-degrading monooxygenase HmoA
MYIRVTTVQVKPGMREGSISIYRDSVVPALKKQKGFKGAMLLTDPNIDKSISLTMWDTASDMHETESDGFYKEQIEKFHDVLAVTPEREDYEITVQA